MLRLAGPRFLLYGLFIGAVAAAAALSHLGTGGIVAAMAATWLLLSALEWAVSRAVAPAEGEAEEEDAEDPRRVRPATSFAAVSPLAPEAPAIAAPTPTAEPTSEPESAPEPVAVQESGVPPEVPPPAALPEPERMPAPPLAPERLRPRLERPVRQPAREPERPPARQPPPAERTPEPKPAVPVPPARPAPETPAPQPKPQPVAGATPLMPVGGRGGREWNIWDLERATREAAGVDAFKDEERAYLLMYLREFANADGILPPDFDGLIRDSFGDLSGVR